MKMKTAKKSIRSLSLAVIFCMLAAFLPMMGDKAFTAYAGDDDFTIESGILTKYTGSDAVVTIPSGVSVIDERAFYGNTTVTTVKLNSSVTEICSQAFRDCSNLTTVSNTGSLKVIRDYAFANCKKLTGITLPNVTILGRSVFYNCESITSITLPDTVRAVGMQMFQGCKSLKSVKLPDNSSVTSLGGYTFYNCYSLTDVTLPSQLKRLGTYEFAYCKALTSLTIPDTVTEIGTQAFQSCTGFTSFTIPANVKTVNQNAFKDCTALKTVTFADVETSVDDNAFTNSGVATVNYAGSKTQWAYYGMDTVFDSSVTVNYNYGSPFVIDEDNVLTAYTGTGGNVSIPYGVTAIGNNAFYGSASVTGIAIPDSVTEIGEGAFSGCSSLTSIYIPSSVTSIGKWCFDSCTALTDIHVPDSNEDYCSVDGILYNKSKTTVIRCPEGKSGTSYSIPSTVTTIGDSAFYPCESLTAVTVPLRSRSWTIIVSAPVMPLPISPFRQA